eukprot:CAMPEP_0197243276 /NCGR_PEP_ID=MMETSP1429-20130617/8786_1 /TAXON_ID=49237 /ORGANISM="Chaetoceros  sp., Strain UNC1202" /LENGTH=274 /DNA_ID=CAMNT_0042703471 /DNA_START=8 /DNA_END=832 /DNA_ORIENTATION=+
MPRLNEIAKERQRVYTSGNTGSGINQNLSYNYADDAANMHDASIGTEGLQYKPPRHVLDNVSVETPASTDELLSLIARLDEGIIERNQCAKVQMEIEGRSSPISASQSEQYPVKLIILDSIAAPTRRDFGGGDAPQRVSALFQIAQNLKRIADQMQVAVVVINQVGKTKGGGINSNDTRGNDFVSISAALGESWHHCVSTRVALEHEKDPHRDDSAYSIMADRGRVRKATITKSNLVGESSMRFEVTAMGVCEVSMIKDIVHEVHMLEQHQYER